MVIIFRFDYRALGVLLHTIIYGENPFHHYEDIIEAKYSCSIKRKIGKDLKKLLEHMLAYNIHNRATIDQVYLLNLLNRL
jgi:serine/threonine protein kinase